MQLEQYNSYSNFRTRSKEKSDASTRLLNQILNEAQSLNGGNLVVACTNCPNQIDSALIRRFKQCLKIPLPDETCRRKILEDLIKGNVFDPLTFF